MSKVKHILFWCENGHNKIGWHVGWNRVNQNKITPCPVCRKMPSAGKIEEAKKHILSKKVVNAL